MQECNGGLAWSAFPVVAATNAKHTVVLGNAGADAWGGVWVEATLCEPFGGDARLDFRAVCRFSTHLILIVVSRSDNAVVVVSAGTPNPAQ